MACTSFFYLLLQIFQILTLASRICDDVEELWTETSDDCVVNYAAGCRVEKAGERGMICLKSGSGGWGNAFKEGGRARAGEAMLNPGKREYQAKLPKYACEMEEKGRKVHMSHIKQASLFPRPLV